MTQPVTTKLPEDKGRDPNLDRDEGRKSDRDKGAPPSKGRKDNDR